MAIKIVFTAAFGVVGLLFLCAMLLPVLRLMLALLLQDGLNGPLLTFSAVMFGVTAVLIHLMWQKPKSL